MALNVSAVPGMSKLAVYSNKASHGCLRARATASSYQSASCVSLLLIDGVLLRLLSINENSHSETHFVSCPIGVDWPHPKDGPPMFFFSFSFS